MRVRWLGRVAAVAVLGTLAAPFDVAGGGRKNTRDFPESTLCPVNLGWFVDEFGVVQPPPASPIRPAAHTFVATGLTAKVSLVSCDRGLRDDHPDGRDLWVTNFAVVRKDVYESHQAAAVYSSLGSSCYVPNGTETEFTRTVGSTFDPSIAPQAAPNSVRFPFFDDFSNLTASNLRWNLDGAEFKTVTVSDPRSATPTLASVLALARVPADPNQNSCSQASAWVFNLRRGQTYVIDFFWQTNGMEPAPDIEMLTFVDTSPR